VPRPAPVYTGVAAITAFVEGDASARTGLPARA
jgi:hypothetical protein